MSVRTVHTGLYSDYAVNILTNFFNYLRKNGSVRQMHIAEVVTFNRAPDGEVLIDAYLQGSFVTGIRSYGFTAYPRTIWDHKEKPDSALKLWMAVNIKQTTIDLCKSDGAWRRNNDCKIADFCDREKRYLSPIPDANGHCIGCPTVEELYLIYDFFLGRSNLAKKYSNELIASILGTRRDPVLTEMEMNRRTEIERLRQEAKDATNAAYNAYRAATNEAETKYNAKVAEIEKLRDMKINELNEKVDALLKLQAA